VHSELETLDRGIRQCRKCRLWEGRTRAVPGEGPAHARIMFIGEAPGEVEDREGRPFRGRSGLYLDRALASAGMTRDQVYITGSVKCRPPRNREPRPDELETCRTAWLERQIEAIDPELIVLLGRVALRQVLGEEGPLAAHRGRMVAAGRRSILPTYHPAAAMRFPAARQALSEDLLRVRQHFAAGDTGVQ
jgi:uracil-DNA glycosylase family 4